MNRRNEYGTVILVSHDRAFLDGCIDHVLALNRNSIEVVQGNFSSWWRNKRQRGASEAKENERLWKIYDSEGDFGCSRWMVAAGLKIFYISQDTSGLSGCLEDFAEKQKIDDTLFRSILRKLDFTREQFGKEMQYYSEGQKKKVLLAESLCEQAHLYLWDEPLNFIDIFSRIQLEELLINYPLTMLLVEHDEAFAEKIRPEAISLNQLTQRSI